MTRIVEFTDEEISAAIKLIDLAVKTGGLNVAVAGVTIAERLQKAPEKPEFPRAKRKA